MIIDIEKFVAGEREHWKELESILDRLAKKPDSGLSIEQVERFHYLYERVSADLNKITVIPTERETMAYLESLVARAYGEIHETRERPYRIRPMHWFFTTFPVTFRRHRKAFYLAVAITMIGALFGSLLFTVDPSAKSVVLPWSHLLDDPATRVKKEESVRDDRLKGIKTQGAAWYMTHNTKVSMLTMASGITCGIFTVIVIFSNGLILGALCTDYISAGQTTFLVGWLLPHGSVEIPAFLLAGQAGFMIAGALIGWGRRKSLRARFREISGDLVTMIGGVAILLVWAGIVEAFLSQYHEPVLPYSFKIAMGTVQLILVILFLSRSGRRSGELGKRE